MARSRRDRSSGTGASHQYDAIDLSGHERWVLSIATVPGGRHFVSGAEDQTVRIWDVQETLRRRRGVSRVLCRQESAVTSLAVSPDGRQVAIGTWNGHLELRSIQDGGRILSMDGHDEAINALDYSADGAYLAAGGADDQWTVWDTSTGEQVLCGDIANEYDVKTVAFSPDGSVLLTGDGDQGLTLWSTETGDILESLEGHRGTVTSAEFLKGEEQVISSSWDGEVRIWDVRRSDVKRTFHHPAVEVARVRQFDKGRRFVSLADDGKVRIWGIASGCVEWQSVASGALISFDLSTQGDWIAAGGDGRIAFFTRKR